MVVGAERQVNGKRKGEAERGLFSFNCEGSHSRNKDARNGAPVILGALGMPARTHGHHGFLIRGNLGAVTGIWGE